MVEDAGSGLGVGVCPRRCRGGSPLLLCGVVFAGGAGFGRVCQWRGWATTPTVSWCANGAVGDGRCLQGAIGRRGVERLFWNGYFGVRPRSRERSPRRGDGAGSGLGAGVSAALPRRVAFVVMRGGGCRWCGFWACVPGRFGRRPLRCLGVSRGRGERESRRGFAT